MIYFRESLYIFIPHASESSSSNPANIFFDLFSGLVPFLLSFAAFGSTTGV